MRTRKTAQYFAAAMIPAALAAPALAGEGGDVGFALVNGELRTVLALDDQGDSAAAFPEGFSVERVFAADFDATGFADEPGFYINSFSNIAVGLDLSYTQEGALLEWNGSDFVATDHQLRQIITPTISTVTPSSGTAPGFDFPYSGGEFDQHPDLQLENLSGPIEAGVYLWNISFSLLDNGTTVAESQNVFIVLNFGVDESIHDAAIEYAESIIPTPGAATVLAMTGLIATRRRR